MDEILELKSLRKVSLIDPQCTIKGKVQYSSSGRQLQVKKAHN